MLNLFSKQNEGGFKGNTRIQIFFFQKESRQGEVKWLVFMLWYNFSVAYISQLLKKVTA